MQAVTTIGLDIAKSVFQVHDIELPGQVVIRHQWKRPHVLAFFRKRCCQAAALSAADT
jgi:transposase